MSFWIAIATLGGAFAVAGMAGEIRRYRRGEITSRRLAALTVGLVSFMGYALATNIRPDDLSGPVAGAILLPALLAMVALIRDYRQTCSSGG